MNQTKKVAIMNVTNIGDATTSRLAAAAWLSPWFLREFPKLMLVSYACTLTLGLSMGKSNFRGGVIGADFIDWWSASSLLLSQPAANVYEQGPLWSIEKLVAGPTALYTQFPYPPTYLLIIAPLGCLPYLWSFALWSGILLSAYLLVLHAIEPRSTWLALAFPGAIVNLLCGQNGFLTLSLVGTAIMYLDRWPTVAGTLFGLSAYKPQFAILVLPFLLITGRWRTLLATLATVCLLCGISFAVFGRTTWSAFFRSTGFTRTVVLEQGASGFHKFWSVFSGARLLGFNIETAYLVQAMAAAVATFSALYVWRRADNVRLEGAALVTAATLVTPYELHYDLVLLALPIAWLAAEGLRAGFLPWEKDVLVAGWFFPILALPLAGHGLPLGPTLPMALLATVLRRTMRMGEARSNWGKLSSA
jgi:hypothetical protein